MRLDQLVVQRGLAPSRERARALILAGQITVDGQISSKAGTQLPDTVELALRGEQLRFVSRGGLKLEGALKHFSLDVSRRVALDIGQSTGGFTDCLLQRGARHVIGVDVGYGQLAWSLRQDPRVTCIERVNARHLDVQRLQDATPADCWPPELAVVDVSFITLRIVLPKVAELLAGGAPIVALIKPQFEAGRAQVGKGGVVRDEATRQAVIEKVLDWARAQAYSIDGGLDSPVAGPKGNVEYLALLRTPETMDTAEATAPTDH